MSPLSMSFIKELIQYLVGGLYLEAERMTNGIRLNASEIERAIKEYGQTLIMPPDEALVRDEIQVINCTIPTWSVICDLWTLEDGPSDLSVELTVIEEDKGTRIEIDGIHVL